MTHLEKASLRELPGLRDMLLELGPGEAGFNGTTFGRGEATLEQFLQFCVDCEDPQKTPKNFVPQTTFWILNEPNTIVGYLRVRHCLNDSLRKSGGHIGYFIRRAHRQKGHATAAVKLALEELRKLKVDRVLITVNPANIPSQKVALNCGAIQEPASETAEVLKFWIALQRFDRAQRLP